MSDSFNVFVSSPASSSCVIFQFTKAFQSFAPGAVQSYFIRPSLIRWAAIVIACVSGGDKYFVNSSQVFTSIFRETSSRSESGNQVATFTPGIVAGSRLPDSSARRRPSGVITVIHFPSGDQE